MKPQIITSMSHFELLELRASTKELDASFLLALLNSSSYSTTIAKGALPAMAISYLVQRLGKMKPQNNCINDAL